MNRWGVVAAMLLAVAGALALRLPHLDARPLHNDEAVNATKVTALWQQGRYAYDPHEYHGPTLHYFSLPFLWLSGARTPDQLRDATLRLAPVAFGVGLILLLVLFLDGLGRRAIVWAGVFTAVSPAMVFYSRYFIHEMLLVFFTALSIGAGWRFHQTGLTRWAVVAGAGVGLMWATKETFVLAMVAMTAAAVAVLFWKPASEATVSLPVSTAPEDEPASRHQGILKPRHAALALFSLLVVWILFFTSCFTNWHGLADSVLTYLPWLKRAGGHSPHIYPWSFYFERLVWFHPARSPVWSEALILGLAAVGGCVSLFRRKTPLHRFLTIYTVALTLIYCVISYKTPWCLLGFYHGMILLAGVGAAAMLECCASRALRISLTALLVVLTTQLAWQAVRASFVYPADRRNPYVYAQTAPDYLKLVQTVEGIARVAPERYETVVKVVMPGNDYWPLPWHLRRFQNVGWYEQLPADALSPVLIVSSKYNARLDEKSERKWILAAIHELRPQVFLELYVELELWKQYVATLPRESEEP